ncbi:MAG: M20/M25/M40 family metallo-hydrolase, partial [Ignavibacteria bacterium]|nr:M20/M25/M40 family metallo-hydrolase [Ignavibacteria bacterium]
MGSLVSISQNSRKLVVYKSRILNYFKNIYILYYTKYNRVIMKKILFLILFTTHLSVAQTVTIPGIESISSTNMLKTVEFLASEKLQGRLSGSPGYYEAAEYMKNEFQKIGLKPAFGNDYYQYFYTEYNEITSAGFTVFDNSGNPRIYELGKDFVCRGFTGSGEIKSEVVFCGYGEALGDYNDYQNTDVRNKIVMFFKQDASFLKQESFGGATLRHRVNLAVKNGAKGIILVSKPNDRNPQKPIGSVMDGDGEFQPNCPVIHIDLQTADEILKEKKYKIKNLQSVIDSTEHPFSFNTGVTAEIEIKAQYEKERKTMNIAGIYEGTDDSLKNEYIVIGAHLDHVGGQAGKIYFPGANDNASGSAGVLEIAKTFAEKGIKTKRSIIFVLFSNEESGLQGAKQFINNPPLPLTPDPQPLIP